MILHVQKANVKQSISQFSKQPWTVILVKREAKVKDWYACRHFTTMRGTRKAMIAIIFPDRLVICRF
jgi:hypothetical protein